MAEEKVSTPKWSEITSDDRWINAKPKARSQVRDKWLKSLYKEHPSLTGKEKIDIESRTFSEWDGPQQQTTTDEPEPIARTPQVEVNPEPFDVTLNQIAGMPPGTTVEGAAVQPGPRPALSPPPSEVAPTEAPEPDASVAKFATSRLIRAMPGFGMIQRAAQAKAQGRDFGFRDAIAGTIQDIGNTIEGVKAFGLPQAVTLGGQDISAKKAALTKDIQVPKDPLAAIGYLSGKFLDPAKGVKALRKVFKGGDLVTLDTVYKETTGKSLKEEHGKVKGTLIDVLMTAATDPALGIDVLIGGAVGAKSLKEVLEVAAKAVADDKLAATVAKRPELRKGFNLLQDAVTGGKRGKIKKAKVARKQPPGPQRKALPPALDRTKGKGFKIIKPPKGQLAPPKKQLTAGAGKLPAAGGTQKAIPIGTKAIPLGAAKSASKFGLQVKGKTEIGTWLHNPTKKAIGDIPAGSTRIFQGDLTSKNIAEAFRISQIPKELTEHVKSLDNTVKQIKAIRAEGKYSFIDQRNVDKIFNKVEKDVTAWGKRNGVDVTELLKSVGKSKAAIDNINPVQIDPSGGLPSGKAHIPATKDISDILKKVESAFPSLKNIVKQAPPISAEAKALRAQRQASHRAKAAARKVATKAEQEAAEESFRKIMRTSQKFRGSIGTEAVATALRVKQPGKIRTAQDLGKKLIDDINHQYNLGKISEGGRDRLRAEVFTNQFIKEGIVSKETAATMKKNLSNQPMGELIRQAASDIAEKFNLLGKAGATFVTDPKLNKQQQNIINERLNAVTAELLRRFKKSGKGKFKDFKTYLKEATDLTPEQQAVITRQSILRGKKAVPAEVAAQLDGATTGAQKAERMFNATEAESKRLNKKNRSLTKLYETLKRTTVDVSGNIKSKLLKQGGAQGRQVVIDHDLTRGARAKAGRMIEEATKKIYKGLTKDQERILNRVIHARRSITIEGYRPEIGQPWNLGKKEMSEYLSSLPKETRDIVNARANEYFSVMREQLKDMVKGGLISKREFRDLASKGDYSPRNFLKFLDPERSYQSLGGKKITVPDSGIKALEAGDYGLLELDSRKLLHQVVTRTQHRVMRNNANGSLYQLAKDFPENGIVRLAKIKKQAKSGKLFYEDAPPGHEKLSVMIDGKRKAMIMESGLAKEWVENDPIVNAAAANFFGWASGTKILKAMATGLNPEFALTNFPRDLAHIWLTTDQYSPHLFKAPFQMAADLGRTAKDAFRRKGAYLDYIDEGGGMEFLTHQGKIGALGKLGKWLGYVGETSEVWSRLALRNRALKNGKLGDEATWIARNYLDFSQGGNVAKGADSVLPYLNASIQGSRGIVRAATTKGGRAKFAYKAAQIGTLASGLYLANKIRNPEAWESVKPRDKVNNWVFTLNLPYKDRNGEIRYPYIKIAKDQGQRAIATVFESLMAKFMGEKVDGGQVSQAVMDFLPLIPTTAIPPVMDAILGYASNKDFWAQEDIWRGPTVSPELEYTKYTHPGFKELGEVTGLSPDRTRFALQQFFTYGNIYTSMLGGGLDWAMGNLDKKQQIAVTDEIRQKPFMRKVIKATDPYTPFEKEADKKKLEEQDRRYLQRLKVDELTDEWLDSESPKAKKSLDTYIKSQGTIDRARLLNRVKFSRQIHKLRDKKWWLSLQSATPEVRARLYWSRFRASNKRERVRLDKTMKKFPSIRSARFARELKKLKKGGLVGEALVKPR